MDGIVARQLASQGCSSRKYSELIPDSVVSQSKFKKIGLNREALV